jgi:DNA-binding MarR family transcriptional regulator
MTGAGMATGVGRTATATPRTEARADTETAARLRLVVSRLARALRQHGAAGLTPSQLSALSAIVDFGPLRTSELAAREVVGAPFATRVVASLEALGYVDRVDDPTDGRAHLVAVTAAGRQTIEELWSERTAGLTGRIAKLTTDQVAALDQALGVLELLARESDPA